MMSMTNNSNIKIKRTSATSASSGSKEAAVTTTTMTKPTKSSTTTKSSFRLKLSIPKSMKKKKEKKQSNNGVAAVVTGNEYKIQNVAVISPKSLTTIPSSEDVDDHNHHETTTTGSSNNDATTARSNDDVKVEEGEFNLADDQSLLLETDDGDDVQSMAEWSGQIKMTDDDDDTCVSGSSESILSSSVQQKRGSIQLRPKRRGSKLLPPSMNDDDDDDELLMLHDELHSSRHGDDPENKKHSDNGDKENNEQPRYEMMGDVYVRSDSALSISSSSNKNHKPTTANNHQTDLIKSKLNILTGSSSTTTTTEIKGATMNDNNNDENDDEQSGMRTPSIATQSEVGDDNVEEEVHIEGETPVRHKGIQVHDDEDDHLLNTSLRGKMFTIEGLRQQAANKTKTKDELPQSLEMNITDKDEAEAVLPASKAAASIRMKILLLSPEHRKFELIKVKCTQDTSVDDVLTKLIPTTTNDPLFNKTLTYKSLCRVTSLSKNLGSSPSCASKSSATSRGSSKENNASPSGSCSMEVFVNAFPLEVYDIRSKHYLIAIPSSDTWSVGDVADMGYAILQQAKQAKKQDRLLGAVGSPDSRSSGGSGHKSLSRSTDIMTPINEMTALTEEKIVPTTLETSSVTDVVATITKSTTSFWSNLFKFVLKMIGIWCLCMSFVALIAEDLRLRTPLGVGDVMEIGELKNKCGLLDIFLPTNTLRQMLGIELCPEGPSATLELVTYQSEGDVSTNHQMALIYYEDSKPIWEMIPSSTTTSSWFKHSTKNTVASDITSTLTIDPKGHVWMGGSPAKLVLSNNKGRKHSSSSNKSIRLSPWPFEQEPIGLSMH